MLDFAVDILEEAGAIALHHFRSDLDISNKAGGNAFDPVTEADRAIERQLRDRIEARYPGHGILGEEYGRRAGTEPLEWIIDPIDGTRAFVAGLPTWGMLLGLSEDGAPRLGAMHQPFLGETFFGDGSTAELKDRRGTHGLRARTGAGIEQAIVCSTDPDMFAGEYEHQAFARVEARCRLRRYGTDCYAYCMLAAGIVDAVVETLMQPYDIVPLIPIVEGAGGVVTDWDGGSAAQGGRLVAAATGALHEQILGLLAGS